MKIPSNIPHSAPSIDRTIGSSKVCQFGLVVLFCLSGFYLAASESRQVKLIRTPDGGIQPQAAVDSKGVVHLIYYKGEADNGDIFYVRQKLGENTFSSPIPV